MLRKARIKDIAHIHRLINSCAERGEMLPRSLAELYDNMRDYFVYEDHETGEVQGACALHICWEDLAEIRSLCVATTLRHGASARDLVRECMEEARRVRHEEALRADLSFRVLRAVRLQEVEKTELPQKIWTDCVKCPKFPLCDEVAMIARLREPLILP